MTKYSLVALGGTFDRLHQGHQHFLETAFKVSKKVIIGITTDSFPHQKQAANVLQPFTIRLSELEAFLKQKKLFSRALVVPLYDPYGPTTTNEQIQALVVTPNTKTGAKMINQQRHQNHLPQLPIIVAKMVKDQQRRYLSSTRIRLGKVSRGGIVYEKIISQTHVLTLKQRKILHHPQGELIQNPTPADILQRINQQPTPTVSAVGDVAVSFFLRHHLSLSCGIYDCRVKRRSSNLVEALLPHAATRIQVTNQPATISKNLTKAIKATLDSPPSFIKIKGEEDLAVLPLVLLTPLNSLIIYGQPGEGLVALRANEEAKDKYFQFLKIT